MPPILQLYKEKGKIKLNKLRLEDITKDKRTSLLKLEDFAKPCFKIENNVYIVRNDMFFRMARLMDTSSIPIDAMLCRKGEVNIVIVPRKSYVFWNGKSIEPNEYHILQTTENIQKRLESC